MPIPTRAASVRNKTIATLSSEQLHTAQSKPDVAQNNAESRRTIPVSLSSRAPRSTPQSDPPSSQPRLVTTRTGIPSSLASSSKLIRTPSTKLPVKDAASSKNTIEQTRRQNDQASFDSSQSITKRTRTVSTATTTSSRTVQAAGTLGVSTHRSSSHRVPLRSAQPSSNSNLSNHAASSRLLESDTHTTVLRDEFLQLNLLYDGASQTLAVYKQSLSKRAIQQGEEINLQQDRVVNAERQTRQVQSSNDLRLWLERHNATSDAQQILTLSQTIQELNLCHNELDTGHYLNRFESWMNESLLSIQNRQVADRDTEAQSIDLIDSEWSQRMRAIHQRLSTCLATLQELGSINGSSGTAFIMKKHVDLAFIVMREIETALSIEADITQVELAWRATQLKQALDYVSADRQALGDERKGIWHRSV